MRFPPQLVLAGLLALVVALVATPPATATSATDAVDPATNIRIVSIGDFHGSLDAAARMAGEVERLRAENPNTIVVGTGDLIGWSQAESDLTRDEFALDVLGEVNLVASALGNHEFDDGMAELFRLIEGGCHPVDGCFDRDGDGEPDAWHGAPFPYLAANIIDDRTGAQPFPGSAVVEVAGVSIGLVGTVTTTTPGHVGWEKFRGYEMQSEAEATNREAAALRAQGVDVIVALVHEGVAFDDDASCALPTDGPLYDIAQQITADVDLIIGGHYHRRSVCDVADPDGVDRTVVQPGSHATSVGVSDLVIDGATGEVDRGASQSAVHVVPPDAAQDAAVRHITDQAAAEALRVGSQVVGRVSDDIMRPRDETGAIGTSESEVDNLVADAQLAWVNEHVPAGAELAITSNWLTRDDLLYRRSGDEQVDGLITRRELWQAQIYDPSMLVVEMTGAEIEQMFQQQWLPPNRPKLGVSENVRYVRDDAMTVVPGGATADRFVVDGELLDRDRTYRVAINSILSRGIENYFPVFLGVGLDRRHDTDVSTAVPLADYLADNAPGPAGLTGRMPSPDDLEGHLAIPSVIVADDGTRGRVRNARVTVDAAVDLDGPVTVEIATDPHIALRSAGDQRCQRGRTVVCTFDGLSGSATIDVSLVGIGPAADVVDITVTTSGPFLERGSSITQRLP